MARSTLVTVRVGIVIAAALTIACFAIFSIGHGRQLLKRTDRIEAHFSRINGLQTGAPVMLSGVNIGAVESISFPSDPHANYVIVRMWIVDSALPRVRSDALAEINTMGLLGDKFVEITGGNPQSPPIQPGKVLASRDPIDYQSLLQKQETSDLIANVIAISQSLRAILDQVEKGHSLLSELVRGEPEGEPQLALGDIRRTFDNVSQLALEMNQMVQRINRGKGLVGAMLSEKTNGRKILADMQGAAASMKATSVKLNLLIDRFNNARGTVPRLLEDQQYANQLLNDMRQSAADMKDILHKINNGQGSVGLAVNDPALYNNAAGFLSGSGSVGWGVRLLNGLYSITHPFSSAEQPSVLPAPAMATDSAPPPQPASQPPASASDPAAPASAPSTADSQPRSASSPAH